MRTIFFTLSLTLLLCTAALAQVQLNGSLTDRQSGEAIPFASVVLRSTADTTQPHATITDLNGCYALQLPAGEYSLSISCLGYEPLRAVRQLQGEQQQWADSLNVDAQQIDEVRITAVGSSALRKSYTFSAAEVRQSQQGHDLLQHLPMLKMDLASGAIVGQGGKSVLLLVNGSTATDNDVRMLPPKAIKRVDVYDIPPARYQGVADYVVNIITAELENGVAGGFDLHHALLTLYGTDRAYLSLVRGHHKLSLDYDLNLHDYNRYSYNTEFDYELANVKHKLSYKSTGRDARTNHAPRLKYAYVNLDKRIVELTLKPNFSTSLNRRQGIGRYEQDGGLYAEDLSTTSADQERTLNPAADLYYWRKLGEADELSLNVAAAHFDTRRDHSEHEQRTTDNATMFADTLALHNTKASVIGELSYAHTLSFGRWETGYRVQYAWLNSLYDNSFGHSAYSSTQLQQYAHTELSGALGKFSYSLSLGVTHLHTNMGDQVYNQPLLTSRAVLGYGPVRVLYQFFPNHPDVADLSSNARYLSRHIIERGNPALRSDNLHALQSVITVKDAPAFVLELYPQLGYGKNSLVKRFAEKEGHYELQVINANREKVAGFGVYSHVYPFGEVLGLGTTLVPMYRKMWWDDGQHGWFTVVNDYWLELNIKAFTMTYQLSFSSDRMSRDGYKTRNTYDDGFSHIKARYQLGSWRFSASLLWLGMEPTRRAEMLSSEPVRYVHSRVWSNARNMLTLGVAYHFGRGKDWEYRRQLENSDTAVPNQ